MSKILKDREQFISTCSKNGGQFKCDSESVAGSVSQRACVYCGARVVLNPITDAYHIVHGPIGCASYTWDIRGSLSSGEETYRNSFSTDLREKDIIFGGAEKLTAAIGEIVKKHDAKLIFVYSTCIVGVIGDDVDAVCRDAEARYGIRCISVKSPGFSGHKSVGYKIACNALIELMGHEKPAESEKVKGINFLGDFNLAGEMWIIKDYLRSVGIGVVTGITGDSNYETLRKAPTASLNIVQCAGSMTYLANQMKELYDIPYLKISFCGVTDTCISLRMIAQELGDPEIIERTEQFLQERVLATNPTLEHYRSRLEGKRAAIYVGGGFKAISLIKQFNDLGIKSVVVGTQTGKAEDYEIIRQLAPEECVILDDSNPYELEKFMLEMNTDILVGGVKERPLAYKLGLAFVDHNHERKLPLSGFEGAINFAKEIDLTINSPVWDFIKMGVPV